MATLAGRLLIASPAIAEPHFARSVVLLAAHDERGALGVVLNRPSEVTVGEVADELVALAGPDAPVGLGGPVAPSALLVVAQWRDPARAGLLAFADVGMPSEEQGIDADAVLRARVFAGHAGWGPDQLEAEIEREDWVLETAVHDHVFGADHGALWGSLLEGKGGRYAALARMPSDPSLN